MPAISSLVHQLANNYPSLIFTEGRIARWSSEEATVYYNPREPHAEWVLLHETAHGILGHANYTRDIELLRLEHSAWHHATTVLAPQFDIVIESEFVETQLDTYRDWLHAKSTCPSCQSNGFEQHKHQYHCPHCQTNWQTNTGMDVGVQRVVAQQK